VVRALQRCADPSRSPRVVAGARRVHVAFEVDERGPCLSIGAVCAPRMLRSGSSGLPRSLPGVRRLRLALEVFRCVRAAVTIAGPGATTSVVFVPVQRPGSDRIVPRSRGGSIGLSWASCPSIDVARWCPLPPARSEEPSGFGDRGSHLRRPVPSSWFRTTSTASATCGFAGLLHPAADPGVRRVSRPTDSRIGSEDPPASRSRLPRDALPLEGAPSIPAVPRHRGLMPPWRWTDGHPSALAFEALLRNPGL